MGIDHLVLSNLPEPEMKRQGRVAQVFAQPLAGSQKHVLNNVAGIDPPAQHLVQPQSNHPPKGRAVTLPEFVDGRGVGLLNLLQEPLCFIGIWPHLSIPVSGLAWRSTGCPSCPALEGATGHLNRLVSIAAGRRRRPSFPIRWELEFLLFARFLAEAGSV